MSIRQPMKHHEQINSDVKSVEIPQHIMSQALEQTADIVLVTDHRGIIKYVNSSFETTTGYLKKEAISRKPALLRSGHHGLDFYQNLKNMLVRREASASQDNVIGLKSYFLWCVVQ